MHRTLHRRRMCPGLKHSEAMCPGLKHFEGKCPVGNFPVLKNLGPKLLQRYSRSRRQCRFPLIRRMSDRDSPLYHSLLYPRLQFLPR